MDIQGNTERTVERLKQIAVALVEIRKLIEKPQHLRQLLKEAPGGRVDSKGMNNLLNERMAEVDYLLDEAKAFIKDHPTDPLISATLNRILPAQKIPWYMMYISFRGVITFDIARFKTVYGLILNLLRLMIAREEWDKIKEAVA